MLWPSETFRELERMRRQMDEVFGRTPFSSSYRFPLVNVYDTKDDLVLVAELPGVSKDDIKLDMRDGMLTITGSRKVPEHEKDFSVLRCELPEGSFEKPVRIPTKVDSSKISAKFEDGILSVRMPKSEEAKPRLIAIES